MAHGAMGATETFDLADGNVHTGTLDADLTATLTGYSATGDGISFALFLTQDGTGGWGVTWPASVINASDINAALDTTAGALNIIAFVSADGGTSLYGFVAGSGGGSSSLPAAVDGHGLFTTAPRSRRPWRLSRYSWRTAASPSWRTATSP